MYTLKAKFPETTKLFKGKHPCDVIENVALYLLKVSNGLDDIAYDHLYDGEYELTKNGTRVSFSSDLPVLIENDIANIVWQLDPNNWEIDEGIAVQQRIDYMRNK